MERREIVVPHSARGARIDAFLAHALALSRSQVGLRIEAGDVLVNDVRPRKAGQALHPGELIIVTLPPPPPSDAIPEDLPLSIVYEDEHLVVIDKAAGMVVHPSPGHDCGTLVNALVYRYGTLLAPQPSVDGRPRPGIVHRLDRGTSGLMVVARTPIARDGLMAQIASRAMKRTYVAVVHGARLDDAGTFRTLYGRHPTERKRFSSRVTEGKTAITHFEVLARSTYVALVLCRLETGRTHQIRVHFADAGHPLVGDTMYGARVLIADRAATTLGRPALHSWRLAFIHPVSSEPLAFEARWADDLASLVGVAFA